MKSIEAVLQENPSSYLWEDNKTIDISYNVKDAEFLNLLKDQKCLRCDTHLVYNNEHIVHSITPDVNGIHIMCRECGQQYFTHKIIKFLS